MFKFFPLVLLLTASNLLAQTDFKVAGVQFIAPSAWNSETPSSGMRAAQWSIKYDKKGESPGEVVIFYFGVGQGGDADANIKRWLGTMTNAQGAPVDGSVTTRAIHGLKISEVSAYGTYAGSMTASGPGVPPTPKHDFGLAGVVLEGPQGNIFVRFTGPERLVKKSLADFNQFIDSAKPVK